MNIETTLKGMLEAAAGAAKGKWKTLRAFAEPEFRTLAAASKQLAADFANDVAAAAELSTQKKRDAAVAKAKKRATIGFRGLRLAAEAVLIVGEADVKLAAQDAINAAVGVLKGVVNDAAGLVLL
jgi:hypothetical protein